jgi:hypothetical protein
LVHSPEIYLPPVYKLIGVETDVSPSTAVHLMKQVKQDDIVAQITNLLIQIAIEFIATGTVSDASLAALTELLTQIDVLELLNLLDSLIGFLIPQELIDFLVDLGILPPAAKGKQTLMTYVCKMLSGLRGKQDSDVTTA